MNATIRLFLFLSALLALAACGGQNARDMLGLGKRTPDEFRVVSRPPLSVPPDFTLRPPQKQSGTGNSQADSQARALVTGTEAPKKQDYDAERFMGPAETAVGVVNRYDLESSADNRFLANLGVEEADPAIRDKLFADREAAAAAQEKASDDYLFEWLAPKSNDDVVVDAKAEKTRIETNKAAEKPVTEGETPVIEPKKKGLLEDLL